MATTIATLTTKADGSMEGVFATLRVNAPITLIPNTNKSREDAPDTGSSTSARASRSEPAGTASPSVRERNTSRSSWRPPRSA